MPLKTPEVLALDILTIQYGVFCISPRKRHIPEITASHRRGIRMVDLAASNETKVENAPPEIVGAALAILATVID